MRDGVADNTPATQAYRLTWEDISFTPRWSEFKSLWAYQNKMELIIPAKNCCPIEECYTVCTMIGRPTIYGFILLIMIVIVIGIIMRQCQKG